MMFLLFEYRNRKEYKMKIAVDAFGGDNAPDEVIKGAAEAVEMYGVDIILTGDENKIRERIKALGVSDKGLSIVHADGVIQIEDNPLDIRKAKKDCSMGKAFQLVVNGEAHVLGIMRKWMTEPPYYAELGHAIPTDLPKEVEERAALCVRKALKALGVNFGSVNMDMLITPEGKIYIVDIGARMGGNMIGPCIIPYGTGIDYVANMIRNAVGDKVDLTAGEHGAVTTRLLAFGGGIVKRLPDFAEIEKEYGVEIYHHLELGQNVNEYHTNLDGMGYVIARAESADIAEERAQAALDYIGGYIFSSRRASALLKTKLISESVYSDDSPFLYSSHTLLKAVLSARIKGWSAFSALSL